MSSYYSLKISFNDPLLNKDVNKILGVDSNVEFSIWELEKVINENDSYFDYLNYFLDLLENKYHKLAEFGINKNDISIWYLYEYEEQCNMEFSPQILKRLGDNSITLCISCWQK